MGKGPNCLIGHNFWPSADAPTLHPTGGGLFVGVELSACPSSMFEMFFLYLGKP